MAKFYSSLLLHFLIITPCLAQHADAPKIEHIYLNKSDTTRDCYTLIYPPNNSYDAYLFLLPGFGESAAGVLQQTDLPFKLASNGILTIIPTFQDGVLSFGVDSASQASFTRILNDLASKQKITNKRFYVGGYSIGGSSALKYAENASVKPTAIFAIDPPLDFERVYNSAKRDIRLSKESQANPENIYLIDRLEKETGGNPSSNLNEYIAFSPYTFSDTAQTAIKKLGNIPIRIYTEPDIDWWMQERKADYTSMNSTECSAFINELKRLGHPHAALITTHHKGFRKPDNTRHPHSWSIVNTDELIEWLRMQK